MPQIIALSSVLSSLQGLEQEAFIQASEPLFKNSYLKIERAAEHIQEFNLRLVQFFRDNGHAVRVKRDVNPAYDCLEFVPCKAPPPGFMCIIGDAVHNLRAALDHAMSDLEFLTTGKRSNDLHFPVRKRRNEVERAVERRLEGKTPERINNFIVDAIQPYEGGYGDAIWQLHSLDLMDKHRLLIAELKMDYVRNIRYIDETGEEFTFPEWATTRSRSDFIPTGKRNVKVTYKGDAALGVFFSHGMPLERQMIVPTLANLTKVVSRTLFSLDREFQRSRPQPGITNRKH